MSLRHSRYKIKTFTKHSKMTRDFIRVRNDKNRSYIHLLVDLSRCRSGPCFCSSFIDVDFAKRIETDFLEANATTGTPAIKMHGRGYVICNAASNSTYLSSVYIYIYTFSRPEPRANTICPLKCSMLCDYGWNFVHIVERICRDRMMNTGS